MGLIEAEQAARDLATSILRDARFFGGTQGTVEEARILFQSRVAPRLHPVFESVAAERQAMPFNRGSSGSPWAGGARRGRWRWLLAGEAALLAVVGYTIFRDWWVAGDEVTTVTIPGMVELEAGAGDRLAFTVDSDVLFPGANEDDRPGGCRIELTLAQGGRDVEKSTCDPFSSGRGVSIARSTEEGPDEATGLRHLRILGQRVECSLAIRGPGPATLRALGNLDTCVPRADAVVVHVFREKAAVGPAEGPSPSR